MIKRRGLSPRVYEHGRRYCLVMAEGKKRIWTELTRIQDGQPALYRKLTDMKAREIALNAMGNVVSEWLNDVSATHSKKIQANETYM